MTTGQLQAQDLRPLAVDLDGTLLRSDVLYEDATAYVLHRPVAALAIAGLMLRGPAAVKEAVGRTPDFEPAVMPYDERVLDWLREESARGRRLILATATVESRARAIADHLGIFDEVLATASGVNLKASAKCAALVQRFGEGGFDYVGNHADDLAIWRHAATAHVVGASQGLLGQVEAVSPLGRVFPRERSRLRSWIRALRPHQWLKNLLVFVPLLTAHDFSHLAPLAHSMLMFAALCLTASGVYVLNDMSDVVADRHHPVKRNRPFASGSISLLAGWLTFPCMVAAGIALSASTLPVKATVVLVVYLITTTAYTFRLKSEPILDVVALAGLYTVRMVAGGTAIQVPLTIWLLTCSIFFFTSLAVVKRVSELTRLRGSGGEIRGRGYTHEDLELMTILGVASGYAAVIVFALYVNDPTTAALYRKPDLLWLAVPPVLYWVSRLWLLGARGQVDEDPLLFAARDRVSLVVLVLIAAVFVSAKLI